MAKFESFEDSWEEVVKKHSLELVGHRVRVILLPDSEPQNLEQSLAGILAEVDALSVRKQELSYKKPDPFGVELEEKYRKQGFKL